MAATKIISILLLLCFHGVSTVRGDNNCTGLEVLNPDSNLQSINVNCTYYTTPSCEIPDKIPPHLLGDSFVGKPAFFEALSDRNLIDGSYRPRMNLTWRPALSGSDLSNLKGFVVFMEPIAPSSSLVCRVFDLSGSKFTNVKTTFNFLLDKMRAETLYFVRLYSLPWPTWDDELLRAVRQVSFVLTQSKSDSNYETNPKDWVTSISYQLNEEQSIINTTFYFAPDNLNFTQYEVKLLDGRDPLFLTAVQTKKVSHTVMKYGRISFENISTGPYSIGVQAVDMHFSDHRKCQCYSVESQGMFRTCSQCIVSRTPAFNFTSKSPITPSTTQAESSKPEPSPSPSVHPSVSSSDPFHTVNTPNKEDDTWKNVVAAVTGVIAAVILLALIGFFGCRRRLKCQRESNTFTVNPPSNVGANNSAVAPHVNNKMCTVFLVFAEDHESHVEAVGSLARYLHDCCHCQVMFAPWCTHDIQMSGMLRWVMKMLEQSDFILVVNSEAAFYLGQAWRGSKQAEQLCSSPTKDFFLTAFCRLCARLVDTQSLHNVLTTHFDHTAPDFVLTEINQGIRYVLPSHLADVVSVIMHARDPWRSRVVCPPAPHYLLESVKKAAAYERSNPSWFSKNFRVDTVPPFMQRLDSGIESLPRESEDNNLGLDSPPIRLSVDDNWHTYNDIDDECHTYYPTEQDARSICTYGIRNLGGLEEPEDRPGQLPVGHLHVDVEEGVYHLPNTGPMNIPPVSFQGSGDSKSFSPAANHQTSQQGPDRAYGNFQGMAPPVGFSINDIPEEFQPPVDPDMFSSTSISPSEGLRRINMNCDIDWEMAEGEMGGNFKLEWDTCSGKSV